MSKITFRADEDLVERLERFDASKSEVMREALRAYLDEHEPGRDDADERSLDALVAERVDAMLADRLDALSPQDGGRDLNLTISLDGTDDVVREVPREPRRQPRRDTSDARPSGASADASAPEQADAERTCGKCGESVAADHVYCPNCGEKASRRVFCECGDEVRSDWAFCPSCGRRTPAADVLD